MSGLFFLKLLCVFFICGYASGADRYAFVGETVIVRLKGCEWPIQWYVNGFEWNEWEKLKEYGNTANNSDNYADRKRKQIMKGDYSKTLRNVQLNDSGVISCGAPGEQLRLDVIEMEQPPTIIRNEQPIESVFNTTVGELVELVCQFSFWTIPTSTVVPLEASWMVRSGHHAWQGQGERKRESNNVDNKYQVVRVSSSIEFIVDPHHDESIYRCRATDMNNMNTHSVQVEMMVLEKGMPASEIVMVTATALIAVFVVVVLTISYLNMTNHKCFKRIGNGFIMKKEAAPQTVFRPQTVDPESLRITKEEAVRFHKLLAPPLHFDGYD